jgi:hypothetical protein
MTQCEDGYICSGGVSEKPYHYSATYSCPAGHYCIASVANACPKGKWQPLAGQSSADACLSVPAGWYGDELALIDYEDKQCQPGYYCPAES